MGTVFYQLLQMVKEAYKRFSKIFQCRCVPQGHKHHFHQAKTVRRYITKRPMLQAGKDFKKIMYRLKETNEKTLPNS
ncbi:hypothetical protein [Sulfurimonas sp.]|uniref:hypothetical protein n=1 Tax=Sulfurimonas sp. TaxID=2022749 RepID=UPI002B46E083|nr:hypothetical protein [Sulfurimonas sp.]